MPAQLIICASPADRDGAKKPDRQVEEEKEKKASESEGTGGGSGTGSDPYGPYRPIPIGVLNVYGQKPLDIGHFESVAKVLDSVHSRAGLPGGSNTIFASVRHLEDMRNDVKLRSLHSKLEVLPNELTIIVHEEKRRA